MNLAKTQTDPLAQLRQQLQRFTSHNLRGSISQDLTSHGPNSFDFFELLQRIGIQDLTRRFTGLSVQPCEEDELVVIGTLAFTCSYGTCEEIEDSYEVELRVPKSFPRSVPRAFCLDGRIPRKFHHLEDRSFCLGSPLSLQLKSMECGQILAFVEQCVVPYLYSYSHFEKNGWMPFGELDHGKKGILNDYMSIFAVNSPQAAEELVFLASLMRSKANRKPCPCGSGLRVGKCHHKILNKLRKKVGGRLWFRAEYNRLTEGRFKKRKDLGLGPSRHLR